MGRNNPRISYKTSYVFGLQFFVITSSSRNKDGHESKFLTNQTRIENDRTQLDTIGLQHDRTSHCRVEPSDF